MRKISIFIFIIIVFSCEKTDLDTRCPDLSRNFIGCWKWEEIKTINNTWEPLYMGPMQYISITPTSIFYDSIPLLSFEWNHIGCSVVSGFNNSQYVLVEIYNDTMYIIGVNNHTEWKLSKN